MTATTTAAQQQPLASPTDGASSAIAEIAENAENAENSPPSELCEIFYVDNRRKEHVKIQVRLCLEGVYLRRETAQQDHINEQLIRIDDIIGSRCGPRLKKRTRGGLSSCKNPKQPSGPAAERADSSAYLYIYAYLKKDEPLERVQTLRILRFRSSNDYAANLATAELWHRTIKQHKSLRLGGSEPGAPKQLLILLNPKSGQGKGRELFQKQVAPLLQEAETLYDLQITSYANFAQQLVRQRKDLLERYAGIVVASGDGLFYEVLNGLMERPDWRRACREMPLGIIPCGSGNGLAKSVAHHCQEPYDPKPILHATLNCLAGHSTPLDIMRVEVGGQILYSFLAIGWGLIADIDIESETLRSIGAQRFTIWAVKRLIKLRSYKGQLWYLPAAKTTPKSPTSVSQRHMPATTSEFKDLPEEDVEGVELRDEHFADALSLDRASVYRSKADSWHSAASRRTTYYSIGDQSQAGRSNCRSLNLAQRLDEANAEFASGSAPSSLPALKQPLLESDGWICEDGDFVMVHAANTTHLSSDCFFAPDSRLNDGLIYLVIVRAGASRSQLLHFLLSMNTGSHLPESEDPFISVVLVSAFRIVPSGQQGILTVDGERVDFGAIQAEILPGLINVMTTTNGQ